MNLEIQDFCAEFHDKSFSQWMHSKYMSNASQGAWLHNTHSTCQVSSPPTISNKLMFNQKSPTLKVLCRHFQKIFHVSCCDVIDWIDLQIILSVGVYLDTSQTRLLAHDRSHNPCVTLCQSSACAEITAIGCDVSTSTSFYLYIVSFLWHVLSGISPIPLNESP
jgi:hypothetical protein